MHSKNHLLTSTEPSPIVVIQKYCEFLKPISLYRDLTPAQQKIWGELENLLIDIISDLWQYRVDWVFDQEHIFDECEKSSKLP